MKAGKLPPLSERIPADPYVLPHHWVQRGKYGGVIHTAEYSSAGAASTNSLRYFSYGFSGLRWLNDGLDIGPGLIERWASNADASEWTFHLRAGLKWSDGHPLTTEDVMFWWEDIVVPGHFGQVPSDGFRSGNGKLVTMTAVDATTLKFTYDTPVTLAADWLALWPNGGIGTTGPIWVLPKHYCKQFHPKYNKSVPKDWDTAGGLWAQKCDWQRNPDCPTLTGFKCKSFDNNGGIVLERNPYYWCVTKEGDQLPYVDEVVLSVVTNPQIGKLQIQQGNVDFVNGTSMQIDLGDVSGLTKAAGKSRTGLRLWDSSSGTGACFFLNYDYPEDRYRKLFRDRRFRQAISHAYDRATVQKNLYFQTGQRTTGTVGPKCTEFHTPPHGKTVYAEWRDSYIDHDVTKSKQLLAQLGLKDADGDGFVEFPDGSKLTVNVDYPADLSSLLSTNIDQLIADVKKAGLRMVRRPYPPTGYSDQWEQGKFMANASWDFSEGASILTSPRPLVPLDNALWAPLEGAYYALIGTSQEHAEQDVNPWKRHPPRLKPEPDGPIAKMWTLYNKTKFEPDAMGRTRLAWDIMKIHAKDGPFFMGCVANYPNVTVVKTDLQNVPARTDLALNGINGPGKIPCPATYDPECFFWKNPDQHGA